MSEEIIITHEDTLKMLDNLLEKRDSEWWDEFYTDRSKSIPFFQDIPDEELVAYCDRKVFSIGKALDIGCGNGRNSRYLASKGFYVSGIDISEKSINWAKELSGQYRDKLNFQCISLFEYVMDRKSFDFVMDSGCFHHIKPHRREQYLSNIQNCLKDDGYFLMTCFNEEGGADISDYDVYRDYSMHGGLGFSEYKIKKILENYFQVVDFRQMKESDNPYVFGKNFMWVILMKKKG